MKLYKLIFFLLPSLILFSSCKNETSVENGFSSFINTTDSNYLDRYYDIYDPGTGIVDTQEVNVFNYDNAKRVTSIVVSDVSGPAPVLIQTFKYSYSGNDSIPFKTLFIDEDGADYDSITTFHFYDNQQRKIKDSAIEARMSLGTYSTYKTIYLYNYAAAKMYREFTSVQVLPFSNIYTRRDTAILDANGNQLQSKRYDYNGATYDLTTKSDFTYDNHPSPFAKLSFYKASNGFPNGETLIWEYYSPNNRVTQREEYLGALVTTVFYSYVYNNAGYPVTCNLLFNGGPETLIFKYKTL